MEREGKKVGCVSFFRSDVRVEKGQVLDLLFCLRESVCVLVGKSCIPVTILQKERGEVPPVHAYGLIDSLSRLSISVNPSHNALSSLENHQLTPIPEETQA